MPLPFLLLGGAVASGIYGAVKGYQAISDTNEASELSRDAEVLFDSAKQRLSDQKSSTTKQLEALGEAKLKAWSGQMAEFSTLFSQLKDLELTGGGDFVQAVKSMDSNELRQIREISMHASEVVGGGLATLGAGALAGMGAYGGATMFAAASTGTAISSLSGVAATNATLAWFGGGALSAGGLGMAGGMAVLGGIVAGPVLLIGGIMLSAKAKEKLAAAHSNHAEASKVAEEMNCAATALKGIELVVVQFENLIADLCPRFDKALANLDALIRERGTSYVSYSEDERKKVYLAVEFAHLVKRVLETQILSQDGGLQHGLGRQVKAIRSMPLFVEAA